MRRSRLSKVISGALLAASVVGGTITALAADEPAPGAGFASSSLYVKVQLNNPLKLSKLKPGEVVEGTLARDVYSSDRELFPRGSRVRLAVDHKEKRRRTPNDHWPWVVKVFTPRHEQYPVFKMATVSTLSGESRAASLAYLN